MRNFLYRYPLGREICHRIGPAVWRLPSEVRSRLCSERQIPRLKGARVWNYGDAEQVRLPKPVLPDRPPSFGHRVTAQPYPVAQPFVARLEEAWLIGPHATPISAEGRVLLTPFRDQPGIMALEKPDELACWLQRRPPVRSGSGLDHVFSLVNRLDTNYFHWIVEWCGQLEGLLRYREMAGCSPRLLVRKGSPRFVYESLELLGYSRPDIVEWEPTRQAIPVRRLVVGSLPTGCIGCSPRSLRWVRESFLRGAGVPHESRSGNLLLYIPRRCGGWRYVLNEDELIPRLERYGFQVVRPEDTSLRDQIRLFSQARLVAGLHGAGLTNLLFAPGAAVLELLGSYGDGLYYSLAAGLGQPYGCLQCEDENQNVRVDPDAFFRAVERILASLE